MAKALNFNNLKKTFFNVTLSDGTVLLIGTPTKKIYDALISLSGEMEDAESIDNEKINGYIDNIYESCAIVMSHNKNGKVITKEYLEKILDIEDIFIFYNGYMNFINEISNQKN